MTTLKRTPVIAVMGHVDHGKTSLLDAIRDTNVTATEAGGITQNTRAHQINYKGQKMTFIDTPGHEAFSEMRSRGANVTDIVMLVVAADDGIQPQTKESIKFAKRSGVPIIVAINKMDLPGADSAKLKNQLAQNDVLVEEYGGDVQVFEVSALKKTGLEELIEGLLLQAEVMEIKPNKVEKGTASAVVLESKLDSKLGIVSLVLLKAGKFNVGDHVIYPEKDGLKASLVRAILDEHQATVEAAEESDPVWILGLDNVVATGSVLYFTDDEKHIKTLTKSLEEAKVNEVVAEEEREEQDDMMLLASMLATEQKNEAIKQLNVVVRTDTQGTLEVVTNELNKLSDDEVRINILASGTGNITRSDIITAKNARGIVLGFQVIVPSDLAAIVQQERVLVRIYAVIYELIDEVSDAMNGMLEPEEIEEEVARAEIKQVFTLSNGQKIGGSIVKSGNVIKGYRVWVERNGEQIGRGKITSLKRNKDEVKEVTKGMDCGIMIEPQIDIEEGDSIVLYKVEKN